jgi:hypothetical protein
MLLLLLFKVLFKVLFKLVLLLLVVVVVLSIAWLRDHRQIPKSPNQQQSSDGWLLCLVLVEAVSM